MTTVASTNPTVTKKWLLEAELYITDGATFYCKGGTAGGDCDALRIRSTGPEDFYEVRPAWLARGLIVFFLRSCRRLLEEELDPLCFFGNTVVSARRCKWLFQENGALEVGFSSLSCRLRGEGGAFSRTT